MSERLKSLRERRGKHVAEMRVITEAAEKEKRDVSAEEAQKHAELFKKQDELRALIEVEERQVELDRTLAEKVEKEDRAKKDDKEEDTPEKRQMTAFRKYLTGGQRMLTEDEARSLSSGNDTEGGYLNAPRQFVTELLKKVDDMVWIRPRARKFQLNQAESLGVPALDTDPSDADWTTELATGNEDTAMKFGKRELHPQPFAKRIKVSKKLLRTSALPVEGIVMERLAYKFAVTEEKAFLTGDGAKKPLGVFTASSMGISTSRDISTGNTTTAIGFDGLIESKFAVKSQYWPRADWLFHRDAVKNITKLKDGDDQYIWRMSVRDGEPDTLLGRPLMVSEYAPNTFTTGLYVGLFGDFSNYWIADALSMQVQRLIELYAETNQDGFIGRQESDGMPVLEEAFARVKLA